MKTNITICFVIVFLMINGCAKNEEFTKIVTNSSVVFSDNIWCVQDNYIFYSDFEENSLVFYSYNILDNTINKLGDIENPHIYSGDFAIVGDDTYLYCNELIFERNSEKLLHSMYKVDSQKQQLTKVMNDDSEQTLIYVEAVDEKIFALKGRVDGNQAITYLDFVSISDDISQFHDFISKIYDNQKNVGEVIYHFSAYEGYLYLLINETTEESSNWKIEKYDMNGKCTFEYILDNETSKVSEQMVSKFEVLGEYGFIRNFSGNGILFELIDSDTKVIFEEEDLDIANYKENSFVSDKFVLYSRDLQKIWVLESNSENLVRIDLPNVKFKCILMNDEEELIVWGNDIRYYNTDELIGGNENSLIEQ